MEIFKCIHKLNKCLYVIIIALISRICIKMYVEVAKLSVWFDVLVHVMLLNVLIRIVFVTCIYVLSC